MTENTIIKLSIDKSYRRTIMGLGEIYEITSVEKQKKILQRKFHEGTMFLAAKRNYQGRVAFDELKKEVYREGFKVLASGFVDSPLWPSRPRVDKKSPLLRYPWLVILAERLFNLLVFLEFIWRGKKISHMIYVFGKK